LHIVDFKIYYMIYLLYAIGFMISNITKSITIKCIIIWYLC